MSQTKFDEDLIAKIIKKNKKGKIKTVSDATSLLGIDKATAIEYFNEIKRRKAEDEEPKEVTMTKGGWTKKNEVTTTHPAKPQVDEPDEVIELRAEVLTFQNEVIKLKKQLSRKLFLKTKNGNELLSISNETNSAVILELPQPDMVSIIYKGQTTQVDANDLSKVKKEDLTNIKAAIALARK